MPLNTLEEVNVAIELLSVSELSNPQNVQVIMAFIRNGNNATELVPHFIVEKGIKIYGGINEYIESFLRTFDPSRLDDEGKKGARAILAKMLTYHHESDATRQVSEANVERINQQVRGFSGGKSMRKRKMKTKKTKMRFKKFV
jgi:hypothetical protein